MKFHLIDYVRVTGNKRDGWKVGYNRLSKKMFYCRSTKQKDVLQALARWGVIPDAQGHKVVWEDGQYTVFEISTGKPICGFFNSYL